MKLNKHGLSRNIPAEVKREVRQRCGFGCVVCGAAICDYEHFEPEFADALVHNAAGIILLCPTHHRNKGGIISKAKIRQCVSVPYCKRTTFSRVELDINDLTVEVGPFIAHRCTRVLEVKTLVLWPMQNNRQQVVHWPVIWFEPPEELGSPVRLNAEFSSPDSEALVRIEKNEWIGSTKNFDIVTVAGPTRSTFRVDYKPGQRLLEIEFFPPKRIIFHMVNISVAGVPIRLSWGDGESTGYSWRPGFPRLTGNRNYVEDGEVAASM